MSDRERVEDLLAIHREIGDLWKRRDVDRATITEEEFYERNLAWWNAKMVIERSHRWENQVEILTDYLALRAVVEALAAVKPFYDPRHDQWVCPQCGRCRYEHEVAQHEPNCLAEQARLLVGPAGESNPIEFDGVGPAGEREESGKSDA